MSHLTIHGLCRLSRDPELIETKGGTVLVKFGVVTNEKYKDKEETCWSECVAFGKTGEAILEYLKKGALIHISGMSTQDKWEKGGKKHSKHVVKVLRFEFTGEKRDESPAKQEAPSTNDDDSGVSVPF